MKSSPKKCSSGVKNSKPGGIKRFLTKKGSGSSSMSPANEGIDKFLIRKRKPSDDDRETTRSPTKRALFRSPAPPAAAAAAAKSPTKFPPAAKVSAVAKKKKNHYLLDMGFTRHTISSKISFFMTDAMQGKVDEGIERCLFERDAITVPATHQADNTIPIQPIVSNVPLNAEQQRVVECPPNIPLSVRACAGTGKTHTMVQRAISFINNHGINPKSILIVTFSKLATEEVIDRVTRSFGRDTDLPTIKTFHALAYSWVRRYWKICGLGKRPSVLTPKSAETALMKQVFEVILDNRRLERCLRKLELDEESSTWDDVLKTFQTRKQEVYDELAHKANKEAESMVKKKKMTKKEEEQNKNAIQDEVVAKKKFLLRKMCYLNLLGKQKCDLESRWIGTTKECNKRCKEFLDLVDKARLGSHDYNEYPYEDAQVWQLYDRLQRETGQIDFDTMLLLFAEKVLKDERVAKQFHQQYTHVVVDEYQDNSQMQALMLKGVVAKGCLTVVGDDDQCIYEFRGASPGNFDRLKEDFAKRNISVQEEVLTDNHRSSKNILTVARSFLEGDKWRHPKKLKPTKQEGLPVEVWECSTQTQQAKQIVDGMVKRHEDGQVQWKEMAVLFRCQKMGNIGSLTSHLQKELAEKKIPFVVVGGTSIFERASVRDLMAYLQLSIRSSPNDDAFIRSINQPPRRLPKDKVIPIIKEFLDTNTIREERESIHISSLQEAAKTMVEKNVGLTSSRHNALSKFLAQIEEYQEKLNIMSLPELLKYLWKETGLSDSYKNKNKSKAIGEDDDEESDDEDDESVEGQEKEDEEDENSDEDDSRNSESVKPTLKKAIITSPRKPRLAESATQNSTEQVYYPEEISLLIDLAAQHVTDWKKREKILHSPQQNIPSLLEISRKVVLENREAYAFDSLPNHIVDEIVLAPVALGRSVVDEFLAGILLQHSTIDDQPHAFNDGDEKVTISTVHRAKGLEWSDVYVPYLNETFLPTSFRNDDAQSSRHVSTCDAITGGRCNKKCTEYFARIDAKERGGPEERHLNEERRLAHVAATRAKNKLVFLSVDEVYSPMEKNLSKVGKSSFLDNIRTHVSIVNKRRS